MAGGDNFFGALGTQEAVSEDLRALTAVAGANLHEAQTAGQPFVNRKHAAEAEKLELENQNERAMANLMQMGASAQIPGPNGRPVGMADRLDSLATMATQAGLVKKAQDLAKTSALLRSRDAAGEASRQRAFRDNTIGQQHEAQLVGQLFGDVKDAEGWQRANDLYEFQKGAPSPFRDLPYSPELVRDLNNQAMTAYQRGGLALREQRKALLEKYQKERLRLMEQDQERKEMMLVLAEEREDRMAKAGGGKAVSSPAAAETKQAATLLKQDFPDLIGAERDDAAYTIASNARALRRSNPALSPAAAIQQAYQAMVTAGDIEVTPGYSGMGFDTGLGKKTSYVKGKRPETAMPVPADSKKLIEGRYYTNAAGVTAKWTGKGFEVVRTLSRDNNRTPRKPSPGIDPKLITADMEVELGDPDDEDEDD